MPSPVLALVLRLRWNPSIIASENYAGAGHMLIVAGVHYSQVRQIFFEQGTWRWDKTFKGGKNSWEIPRDNIPSASASSCSFWIPPMCLNFGPYRRVITTGCGLGLQIREDHRGGGERRGNCFKVTRFPYSRSRVGSSVSIESWVATQV